MSKKDEQSTKHWWWFGSSKKEAQEETKTKSPAVPPKISHEKKRMSAAEFEAYVTSFESFKKRIQDNRNTVVAGGSLSCDSIKDFTKSLCDIDQVVMGFIQKLKVNIFESKPVRSLIDDYFRVSLQTLELLSELENCLRDAGNSNLPLRLAATKFEKKKYEETLERVEEFKARGDPFKKRFWVLYVKLCDQQISLFNKLLKIHVLVNKPLLPKPKDMAKKKGLQETTVAMGEQLQDDKDTSPTEEPENELNTGTMDQQDTEPKEEENKTVAMDEQQQDDNDTSPTEEPENKLNNETTEQLEELKICAVVTEFENFRSLGLSWTEKVTSLSESADKGLEEEEVAKILVDELKTDVSKFQDDIEHMVDHTRKCKDHILSGRDKVLGLIKTSA